MGTTMGTNTSAVQPMPCWPPPGRSAVVARMSGDEFFVFLYGGASKEEIRNIVRSLHSRLLDTIVLLPGQESMHVRASGGISWYPDDSADYEELIRYADFAMYKVKRTDKGRFKEFDRETYDRERYLLQGKETLNTIIERSLSSGTSSSPFDGCRDG